ncbi:MAG: hypothetical protein ACYDDS_14315 [Candidatus Sulfotelmatobacter sp.]|jgi:hypothetical protein
MASPTVISSEFLLWSQSLPLWSIAAYGVMADPLQGETAHFRWTPWMLVLSARALLAAGLAYALSQSIGWSSWMLLSISFQPIVRYRMPMRLLAEFESLWTAAFLVSSLAIIRHFRVPSRCVPASISPAQLAALCIFVGTLFMVVRGGTYMVRGILGKSGTVPSEKRLNDIPQQPPISSHLSSPQEVPDSPVTIAASVEAGPTTVDEKEYNRGRLIGNLERIVLTIVVAAGSYAALAFLVAAKGVVRSDEFNKNKDFAEYFLIGSLASVLVALCAGIALRFALVRLWPDLLSLQIQ